MAKQISMVSILSTRIAELQETIEELEMVCPRWGNTNEEMERAEALKEAREADIVWYQTLLDGIKNGMICLKNGALDKENY